MIRYNAICTTETASKSQKLYTFPYVTAIVIEQTTRTWLQIIFANFIRSNYRPLNGIELPMFFLVNFFFPRIYMCKTMAPKASSKFSAV